MDKLLFVIGASSDMGYAAIKEVGGQYRTVVAHYLHMNEKLQALKDELGGRLVLVQADLSVEEQVYALIHAVEEQGIPDHILHFPAPICNNQKFHKIKWDVFQKEMDISLKSFVLIGQALLPQMAKRGSGKVILMLSYVVSHIAPAYCSNYVVTKYAMLGLMRALATEYASKGITVNGISPAWVNTKYIANQPDILIRQNEAASPTGQLLEVTDIVPSIRFLLSDGADCITGQNLTISCGR